VRAGNLTAARMLMRDDPLPMYHVAERRRFGRDALPLRRQAIVPRQYEDLPPRVAHLAERQPGQVLVDPRRRSSPSPPRDPDRAVIGFQAG